MFYTSLHGTINLRKFKESEDCEHQILYFIIYYQAKQDGGDMNEDINA